MNAMGFLKCVSCKARGAGAVEAAAPVVEAPAPSSVGGASEEEIASLRKQLEEANNKIAELEKKSVTGAPQTAGGTAVLASRLARQLAQAEKERDDARAALAGAGAGSDDAMELVNLRNKVCYQSFDLNYFMVFCR